MWAAEGPDVRLATSFVPVGDVSPADGGWLLSGDWSWASGVEHCQWIMLGGMISPTDDGHPEYRLGAHEYLLMNIARFGALDLTRSCSASGSAPPDRASGERPRHGERVAAGRNSY